MMKQLRRWVHQWPQQVFTSAPQRGSLGAEPTDPNRQLVKVAERLTHLEDRLRRLRTATDNLAQLQQLQGRLDSSDLALADDELKALQHQADELELAISQQVFSWQALREPFWQAVRFGGLGLVVGWLIRGWVGG